MTTLTDSLTEHQVNWWGNQPCRRCNPAGLSDSRPDTLRPECPDCDGSGWTVWAALATEPWTEIIPNLWVGCHDYNGGSVAQTDYTNPSLRTNVSHAYPKGDFSTVVSMYSRPGFDPSEGVEHHEVLFPDGPLEEEVLQRAEAAARLVADKVRAGQKVLTRCQAGLNRSSLVAGLAMVELGYDGKDAVQLIRARRSPWALCNSHYAEFISGRVKKVGA